MKLISLVLSVILIATLTPDVAFAKKYTVGRPMSKPPVYKKFDNRKKKFARFRFGR